MNDARSDRRWFRRNLDGAIERRDYPAICIYAPGVDPMPLDTKARILDVMRTEKPEHFDKAAGKLICDYIAKRQPGRAAIDDVINWTDPVMFALEPLLERLSGRST